MKNFLIINRSLQFLLFMFKMSTNCQSFRAQSSALHCETVITAIWW